MNFLANLSREAGRFKARYGQYWLDQMVNELQRNAGNKRVAVTGQVLAVLRNPLTGHELVVPGLNIVTNDGDTYYAQSAAAETPDDDFDGASAGLRLGDDNTAPTKTDTDVTNFLAGTGLDVDATYPQSDDQDANNTGAGVDILTWRYSYATGEGNAAGIIEGAIVDDIVTPTAALTHFLFAATFTKTSSDTLAVYVNHEFLGV